MSGDKDITPSPITQFSRWALWEAEVLSKCQDPAGLQQLILQRQIDLDDDRAESSLVRDYFRSKILRAVKTEIWKKFKPDFDVIFIPNRIALDWLCEALSERLIANKASAKLDLLGIPELRRGSGKDARGNGCRGYVWTGLKAPKTHKAVAWPGADGGDDDGTTIRTTMSSS